ncbi:MAG: hypothetical protein QXJ17_02505 [Nitrososphaeria archaeon]
MQMQSTKLTEVGRPKRLSSAKSILIVLGIAIVLTILFIYLSITIMFHSCIICGERFEKLTITKVDTFRFSHEYVLVVYYNNTSPSHVANVTTILMNDMSLTDFWDKAQVDGLPYAVSPGESGSIAIMFPDIDDKKAFESNSTVTITLRTESGTDYPATCRIP